MMLLKSVLLLLFCVYSNSLTCKNENNEAVDWYYLYKLPEEHNSNTLIKNGVAYMYMTSETYETGWILSNRSINDTNSMPGLTLKPFYSNQTEMHIFYNDETPSGAKNEKLGHTKGAVISYNITGLWMIHSVPKFPSNDSYHYPETGVRFGQSFLCISLDLENLNNVGIQLMYNQPQIYDAYIANNYKNVLGNINSLINKEKVKLPPWYRLTSLRSLNGQQFVSFAKSSKFGKELYEDWVAPTFKSDLVVESWLNGAGRLPSDCNNIYHVNNVESINLSETVSFASSKDHSKWAVTSSKGTQKNWICVGDINREEHQKQRGGGTVCTSIDRVWNEYKRCITKTELCE